MFKQSRKASYSKRETFIKKNNMNTLEKKAAEKQQSLIFKFFNDD